MLWINFAGGSAVLASYVYGLASNPLARGAIWGGVPDSLRPLYTVSMLLAAAGYFAFTYFVLFRLDPVELRIAGRLRYRALCVLYALILVPSALWMPLTFAMIASPSGALWLAIRLVLATVGIGSAGLLACLGAIRAPESRGARALAIAGGAAFCFQTAVLDALVWPAFFPS